MHLLVQLPIVVRLRPADAGPWLSGLLDEGVRHVGQLMAPRVLGLTIVQINFLVETFLAAPLGPGSLSALAYAWQAMLLPQAVFAQAAATAAFPTFAEQVARGDFEALRTALSTTLRSVLFLAVPATAGILLLREPFVALLLERGQFTAEDTALVAWALLFYVLGLSAHSALEILTRVFYALHDTRTPVVFGAASIALNVALSLTFIQVFRALGWHPIGGLGLANALATWLETLVLGEIMRRRIGGLEGRRLAFSLGRTAIATVLMSAALAVWLAVIPPGAGTLHQLLVAGGGALAGGAVYTGGAWALGSEEVRALAAPIFRRIRKMQR
jgi:putative peptidoglycan lipid II flippase